ncbi:hypothetical protein HPB51_019629 [Rhipicephalus microplus]|uniref:M13 family peptidase n=1 Tax=Rhipicephalus microplus TaxID=6941 RepID=A0A9J6F5R1_RHIMP|nr:hypothetical protein HPB51_019629 [Rhipicephalus microplus]
MDAGHEPNKPDHSDNPGNKEAHRVARTLTNREARLADPFCPGEQEQGRRENTVREPACRFAPRRLKRSGGRLASSAAFQTLLSFTMAVRGAPEKRKRSVGSSSGSSTSSGRRSDSSKTWGGLLLEQDGMRSGTMSRSRMKRMQVIVIIAMTTVFIACASLLIFLAWFVSQPTIKFCNTPDCIRHALELKKAMNTRVKPCQDFYKFTCGSWKPRGKGRSMVAQVFEQSTTDAIKEMEEGSREKAVVPKAPDYYRNCIHRRDLTPAEAGVFIDFKHQLGLFWPEKPQVAIDALLPLLNMTITWNINLLFHLRALPAYKRRPQTLYIRRGILNTNWLDPKWTPLTFAESVRIHCGVLGVEAPSSSSIQELKNTVDDIVNAALKVPPDATSDTQFKLKQIEYLMPNRSDDWLKHLNILHSPQFTWTLDSPVALEDDAILQNLNALQKKYRDNKQTLLEGFANYIAVATAYRLLIGHDSFISVYSKRLGGGAPSRYNYYYNIAYMSLGAMEPPILYLNGTMAMMYGSFGALIAECLVRSFDKRGVLVNDLGKSELWWDSPAYTQRIRCDLLSDSETGGSDDGVPGTPPPGSRDPREVRFSALFPIAPALTTSFIAHRKAIATDGYVQRRLHGLDDFDDDQIFFLSYCLTTCAVNSTGEACNVPLRQMDRFASAFQCEVDTPMNPQKKCTFF